MFTRCLSGLLMVILLVPPARACTAFVVYRNGLALAGNNEDYWVTDTKMWIVPRAGSKRGVAGKHGRVYFGFNDFFPQGGMNEAGLFFDGFATAANKIKNSRDKPRFEGNMIDHVMAECSTVAEVVAIFEKHDLSFLTNAMLMFGDCHGDSVIIEGDEMLRIDGDYQVVTNFYQSLTPADKCPCNRYKTAVAALEKGDEASVESVRDILAATCQKRGAPTQYSNVYDLNKRLVYLYHFQNFEETVLIDLAKELENGAREVDLPSLFSENRRFKDFQKKRALKLQQQIEARRNDDVDPRAVEECTGRFGYDVGLDSPVRVEFTYKEQKLYATRMDDPERVEIIPEAKDRFFRYGDNGLQIYTFHRDEHNRISAVTVFMKDLDRKFRGEKIE